MGLRPGRTNGKKAFEKARKAGELDHLPSAKSRKAPRKPVTGLRCTICGEYVDKLQQVRRSDGVVVPGCANCAKLARESAVLPASPRTEWGVEQREALITIADATLHTYKSLLAAHAPISEIAPYALALASLWGLGGTARPQPDPRPAPKLPAFMLEPIETRYTSVSDWERANGITRRPLLALPAPRMNEYMRPVRRQLARMCGPRPRYIPTGAIHGKEVIALGPGGKPSPYDPPAIEKTLRELAAETWKLVDLRAKLRPDTEHWRGSNNASWEIRNAEQRVQGAKVRLHFLLRAA